MHKKIIKNKHVVSYLHVFCDYDNVSTIVLSRLPQMFFFISRQPSKYFEMNPFYLICGVRLFLYRCPRRGKARLFLIYYISVIVHHVFPDSKWALPAPGFNLQINISPNSYRNSLINTGLEGRAAQQHKWWNDNNKVAEIVYSECK